MTLIILQSAVSHDPSEITLICWFGAQETLFISVENTYVFVETIIFPGCFDEKKVQKNSIYVIFCNIINVFTVTFDHFNSLLLNKNINVFKIK